MVRAFMILVFIGLIACGCAIPPGKMVESDFVWQEKIVDADIKEVYRRLVYGFRSDDFGDPDGHLFPEINEGYLDVYVKGYKGSVNPVIGGMIKLKGEGNKTIVRVGVTNLADNPLFGKRGGRRERWLAYANGDSIQ